MAVDYVRSSGSPQPFLLLFNIRNSVFDIQHFAVGCQLPPVGWCRQRKLVASGGQICPCREDSQPHLLQGLLAKQGIDPGNPRGWTRTTSSYTKPVLEWVSERLAFLGGIKSCKGFLPVQEGSWVP